MEVRRKEATRKMGWSPESGIGGIGGWRAWPVQRALSGPHDLSRFQLPVVISLEESVGEGCVVRQVKSPRGDGCILHQREAWFKSRQLCFQSSSCQGTWEVASDGLSPRVPATHMGGPNGALGSMVQTGPFPAIVAIQ